MLIETAQKHPYILGGGIAMAVLLIFRNNNAQASSPEIFNAEQIRQSALAYAGISTEQYALQQGTEKVRLQAMSDVAQAMLMSDTVNRQTTSDLVVNLNSNMVDIIRASLAHSSATIHSLNAHDAAVKQSNASVQIAAIQADAAKYIAKKGAKKSGGLLSKITGGIGQVAGAIPALKEIAGAGSAIFAGQGSPFLSLLPTGIGDAGAAMGGGMFGKTSSDAFSAAIPKMFGA